MGVYFFSAWINKMTLKDNTRCFSLLTCGGPCHLSSFQQCSGTLFLPENTLFIHWRRQINMSEFLLLPRWYCNIKNIKTDWKRKLHMACLNNCHIYWSHAVKSCVAVKCYQMNHIFCFSFSIFTTHTRTKHEMEITTFESPEMPCLVTAQLVYLNIFIFVHIHPFSWLKLVRVSEKEQ